MQFQKFMRLTKVDVAQNRIYGTFTAEVVDKSGEVADYETTKKAFQSWSAECQKISGGKILGNVRKMHTAEIAGGVIELNFDDVNKTIGGCVEVKPEITSEAEKGWLNGFSIGGSYVKKWDCPVFKGHKRFTPALAELSIVDNPCVPDATIDAIKGMEFALVRPDGVEEMRKFAPRDEVKPVQLVFKALDGTIHDSEQAAIDHLAAKEAEKAAAPAADALKKLEELAKPGEIEKRDFTDAERKKAADSGAALPDGSFPIHTKEDLHNAVQAYGRAKDKTKARAHIKARAKALGASDMLPENWGKAAFAEDLKKGMGNVARLATIIEDIRWLSESVKFEEVMEDDDKSIAPAELSNAMSHLCSILHAMVQEETAEMMDCGDDAMKSLTDNDVLVLRKLTKNEDLLKGWKFADKDEVKVEVNIMDMPEMKKALADLQSLTAERDAFKKQLDEIPAKIESAIEGINKRLKNIEQQPAPRQEIFVLEKDGDEPKPVVMRSMSPAQRRDMMS